MVVHEKNLPEILNVSTALQYWQDVIDRVQKLPLVRGAWSAAVLHLVAEPPDAALYALDLGTPAITLAADSAGTPEWNPAAAYTSGYAATMFAAIPAPADIPR